MGDEGPKVGRSERPRVDDRQLDAQALARLTESELAMLASIISDVGSINLAEAEAVLARYPELRRKRGADG